MRTKPILLIHALFQFLAILSVIEGFSQNVGIGTTTPAARLQINQRSSITQPGILLRDSTPNHTGLMRFTNVLNAKYMQLWGYYEPGYSANQFLDISSDSTFVATFRGNGNFGIGLFTPDYPLDVNGIINSSSEYRLSGKTAIHWGDQVSGLYRSFNAGDSTGYSNTTGSANTFIGGGAGILNTIGNQNCFLGSRSGYKNVSGSDNTFIGNGAGLNSNGSQNTFVGSWAGFNNGTGYDNTLLGYTAGTNNISGIHNVFVGAFAGFGNVSGENNVFVGEHAGFGNVSGENNTFLGSFTDASSSFLSNTTAIGFRAHVIQSNSLVLGSINGVNGATADTRVGIGTTAPSERLDIVGNLKVSGEVYHPSTGATNLLPIAFGNISSTGVINSGSINFSVTKTATGTYNIDIFNHSFGFSSYSTVITPVAGPLVAGVDSAAGNLLVRLYNLSGTLTDGTFSFVIYKQ